MKHIIKSQQLDQKLINRIFALATALEKKKSQVLKGKIMASLFYEPSTRTRFSFESAMIRLGGSVITTENAKEFSSVAKGETLEDSIKVIGNYADVIVLRHDEQGSAERAASVSSVPIINAGDGAGQHPTQALLDLYTIKRELGKIDGITLALVGDLKNGRTIRSLSYLLGKYKNIKIYFVSPIGLRVGEDIKIYLKEQQTDYEETTDLFSIVGKVDVLYQTRIQKERFATKKEYEKFNGCYTIDGELVKKMKIKSIIMHPLPRVNEILTEVDKLPQAVYFKQTYYGLLIRMALLKLVIKL
ncbi:aspartate carbamoyltransferase [Candidatus Azambacteria bacterium]|nr:aspartate carbamoyltransferase [Candidatus Azambacteria bacterium]